MSTHFYSPFFYEDAVNKVCKKTVYMRHSLVACK